MPLAIRKYRFIRYGSGFEERYDREEDPNKLTNLADDARYHDI